MVCTKRLSQDLLSSIRTLHEVGGFAEAQASESAIPLYRFGCYTPETVKAAMGTNRLRFLADVRGEWIRAPILYLRFIRGPPPKRGRKLHNVDSTESSTPLARASYTASLASLGSPLQTKQGIANEICEALANSEDFHPPYKPYITPEYTTHPWLPRMGMHTAALAKWRARFPPRPWETGYLVADVAAPPPPLHRHGGFAPRLVSLWWSLCAIVACGRDLSIASAENCTYAMIYRKGLLLFLEDSARDRGPLGFRTHLAEIRDEI